MKFTTIFATGLGLFTATTLASQIDCFSEGQGFASGGNEAAYHLVRACKGYDGNAGAFQGFFNPGSGKYACVNDSEGHGISMWIDNLNGSEGFDLGDDDCVKELKSIVDVCRAHGGYINDNYGWRFR